MINTIQLEARMHFVVIESAEYSVREPESDRRQAQILTGGPGFLQAVPIPTWTIFCTGPPELGRNEKNPRCLCEIDYVWMDGKGGEKRFYLLAKQGLCKLQRVLWRVIVVNARSEVTLL
jgi:hypothetical protein